MGEIERTPPRIMVSLSLEELRTLTGMLNPQNQKQDAAAARLWQAFRDVEKLAR